ncbi:MAG: thiamine pyrophosphate-binding protein [Deinococcus sp.]|nr:thiamine pyrophosphate-binding protein [Deinococcus sp.]
MRGGALVVHALQAGGVRTVFGIPGVHNLPIYDALLDSGITHILARHEQGVAFAANGYARATGQLGVALTIGGPGVTYALTPLGEAYADSSPLLLIAAGVERRYQGLALGVLHEMPDQLAVAKPLSGWARRVEMPDQIAEALAEAMRYLRSCRPRPAYAEIPTDVLSAEAEPPRSLRTTGALAGAPPELVQQAAEALGRAKRPVIYAGGGALDAARELVQLAEKLGAPIATSASGKGVIPEDHPLALGSATGLRGRWNGDATRELFSQADGALLVGANLWAPELGLAIPFPENTVQINLDPLELGKVVPARVGLAADARTALRQLLPLLPTKAPWADASAVRQQELQQARQDGPLETALLEEIRAALPRDTILVGDMTLLAYRATRIFPVYAPRSFLSPRGFGTLGFALPAAIGAQAGRPGQPVAAIVGDGGMLYTCGELASAVQHRLPVIVIVVNDGAYAMIKRFQLKEYGRTIAADLSPVNFAQLAEAMGALGYRCRPGQVGEAITQALERRQTAVVEVLTTLNMP